MVPGANSNVNTEERKSSQIMGGKGIPDRAVKIMGKIEGIQLYLNFRYTTNTSFSSSILGQNVTYLHFKKYVLCYWNSSITGVLYNTSNLLPKGSCLAKFYFGKKLEMLYQQAQFLYALDVPPDQTQGWSTRFCPSILAMTDAESDPSLSEESTAQVT